MMFLKTIRSKLFVTFGTLTACICFIFAGLTWLFAVVTEDDVLKQVLASEARYIQGQYLTTNTLVTPRADYIALFADKSAIPQAIYQGYLDNPYEKEFYVNGRNIHIDQYWLNEAESFWLTIDASKLGAIEDLSGPMSWSLLIFSIIMFICALWAAWVLSNRTAKPIEQLTRQVINHRQHDKFTLSEPDRIDEIGQLGRAFEHTLDNLAALLKREVDFTRDVSHELRTPITLLQNTIALAGEKPLTAQDKNLIQQVSEELKNTVEVLLALARSESFVPETVNINASIERSILMVHNSNPDTAFNVRLDIEETISLYSNPNLVNLLFQNLINNGFYHSGDGVMRIYNRENTLVFENEIGENNNSSYQGLGHGHYLVTRIAENINWTIKITNDNKRYCVEVTTQSM